MGPRTVSGQPASVPALDSPQDPALRYVLAVGAVSAGLPLSDAGHDGDTDLSLDVEPIVSDARARMVARGWGIEPVGEPGKAGGCPGTVVVLVDGLGLEMLRRRRGHTPTLRRWLGQCEAGAAGGGNAIRTCRPSTTAAALTMLGTSALPGTTGMVGYSVLNPLLGPALEASAVPGPDQVLSLITWKGDNVPSPRSWQDVPTIFERLPAGSAVSIGPTRFAGSGLTEAALRGATHLGADRLEDWPPALCAAARHWSTSTSASWTKPVTSTDGSVNSGLPSSSASTPPWLSWSAVSRPEPGSSSAPTTAWSTLILTTAST